MKERNAASGEQRKLSIGTTALRRKEKVKVMATTVTTAETTTTTTNGQTSESIFYYNCMQSYIHFMFGLKTQVVALLIDYYCLSIRCIQYARVRDTLICVTPSSEISAINE